MSYSAAAAASRNFTVEQIASTINMKSDTLAKILNAAATDKMTKEMLEAALASKALDANQKQLIATTLQQTAATNAAATSLKGLGVAGTLKAGFSAFAASLLTPVGIVTTLISLLPLAISGIVKLYDTLVVTSEEAKEMGDDFKEAAEAANEEVKSLEEELASTKERILELQALSSDGTISLVEQEELEDLKEYNYELERRINLQKRLAEQNEDDANESYKESFEKRKVQWDSEDYYIAQRELLEQQRNEYLEAGLAVPQEIENEYARLLDIISTGYANGKLVDGNRDTETLLNELIDQYDTLNELREKGVDFYDDDGNLNAIGEYFDAVSEELLSEMEYLDGLAEDYTEDDEFSALLDNLIDSIYKRLFSAEYLENALRELPQTVYDSLESQGRAGTLTGETVDELAEKYPELSAAMGDTGFTADQVAAHFNSLSVEQSGAAEAAEDYREKLTSLTDTMDSVDSIYSVISAAQQEMAESGSVSSDTIQKLSELTDDYSKYLEVQNGKIRLNTQALRELARTKVDSNVDEIKDGIEALERENAEIEYQLSLLKDRDIPANQYAAMADEVEELKNHLELNNQELEYAKSLMAQYQSLMTSWTDTDVSITAFTSGMERLAELQQEIADGFTISAEAAREFGAIYPEILKNAQAAADGQVQLDADVVNGFIAGREGMLKASIQTRISELEAEKAELTAKMESTKAQLDMAQQLAQGEGDMIQQVTEYELTARTMLANSLQEIGVDEVDANTLATAAMAENEEEFARVAMEAFQNMDDNSAKAAYNMARNVFLNANSSTKSIAGIASAANEAAKAIDAMGSGKVYNANIPTQVGGGGRWNSDRYQLTPFQSYFDGAQFDLPPIETSLDDFIADLELDVQSYQDAIDSIDGQIAILKSLMNTDVWDYMPESSGGGSASSSIKTIEEYTAVIEVYREALERLARAQARTADIQRKIDQSDSLMEQIRLHKQLIGSYRQEQDAMHNLNEQRDATIAAGVSSLRALGFEVEYNAVSNELWIDNMERLNELTAQSRGEYDTLQEATNALRQETEELINSITDLNEENEENSNSWFDIEASIKESRNEMQSLLQEIVQQASEAVSSITDVYDTLHQAADEYAETGYITVSTLQAIAEMGVQYLNYLMDENGQLVINEERIRDVVAARSEQLALETSMAYIEALRIARENDNAESLNNLLYATTEASNATWGLVYASLALLDLNGEQYDAALENINALRALAQNASDGFREMGGNLTSELEDMQSGLEDILQYVMDMIRQNVENEIQGLEDMKDAYSEIIELKRKSIEESRKEADRQKDLASKVKELAKLQARIDLLGLDDSREAQAERAQLLEEMAQLQDELNETQADAAQEAQEKALDEMEQDYHDEKDKEIAILEGSISSQEKLYRKAIEYISDHWDTLYSELISWNTEYGSVLNSEITSAWDNCLAAAKRYGDYVSALGSIESDIQASQDSGGNLAVGDSVNDESYSKDDLIHAIVRQMYTNKTSVDWSSLSESEKKEKAGENEKLANDLIALGVPAIRGGDGVWYIGTIGGEKLFDKYRKYIYHEGGIVGGGDPKSNEQFALLKDREWVLSEEMVRTLTEQMDRISRLSEAFKRSDFRQTAVPMLADGLKLDGGSTVNNITTNNNDSRPVEITFGDTIINGAAGDTARQHVEVNRDMVNQIARILGIRR